MAVNCIAEGTATITETIFENRFMHVPELVRMGAQHRRSTATRASCRRAAAVGRHRDGHRPARVGRPGARRPGGRGRDVVDRIYHLDRGYERMEDKLRALGADIERFK